MAYSPAFCYRLISDNLRDIEHQCSLCLFLLGEDENACQHTQPAAAAAAAAAGAIARAATATPFSECSFYSCRSSTSSLSTTSISSDSSSSTIKPRISSSKSAADLEQHALRRRPSPTDLSLRDLHQKQARQVDLRQRRSEEELQQVYERQILEYLNSNIDLSADYADMWTIEE